MAVGGDDAPEDEVPTLGGALQRGIELIGIRRRAVDGTVDLLVAGGVGDGDDGEPRLDHLVVDEAKLRRRRIDLRARRREGLQQRRMRTLFRNSAVLAVNLAHMNTLGVEHVKETGKTTRSVDRPLPYAVPVLIALVILICRSWR